MKIVNRTSFLAMKPGVLFAEWEPCVFGDLRIKGDTIDGIDGDPIDFIYQPIVDAILQDGSSDAFDRQLDAELTGASIPMDFDCEMRDGTFELEQLYAVLEEADVDALIDRLRRALVAAA